MYPVKRVEIISDSIELSKIIAGLKQAGVAKYTVIRNVEGSGIKGTVSHEVDMMENDYVVAICAPSQVDSVIEQLRPVLNRFGGVCLISDAMEVRSIQCSASESNA